MSAAGDANRGGAARQQAAHQALRLLEATTKGHVNSSGSSSSCSNSAPEVPVPRQTPAPAPSQAQFPAWKLQLNSNQLSPTWAGAAGSPPASTPRSSVRMPARRSAFPHHDCVGGQPGGSGSTCSGQSPHTQYACMRRDLDPATARQASAALLINFAKLVGYNKFAGDLVILDRWRRQRECNSSRGNLPFFFQDHPRQRHKTGRLRRSAASHHGRYAQRRAQPACRETREGAIRRIGWPPCE